MAARSVAQDVGRFKGVESCKIVFLGGTSYPLVRGYFCYIVGTDCRMYHLVTMTASQTGRRTDRQHSRQYCV